MGTKSENYRKYIYIGIMTIVLGAVFSTTMKDSVGSLGTVLIAVGGLFFIAGMQMKRKEKEKKK